MCFEFKFWMIPLIGGYIAIAPFYFIALETNEKSNSIAKALVWPVMMLTWPIRKILAWKERVETKLETMKDDINLLRHSDWIHSDRIEYIYKNAKFNKKS